jgi:hypothetical protein
MRNGTARRGQQQDDRFGAGRSREAEQIARALRDEEGVSAGDAAEPSPAEIAQRAYELYLTRGSEGGSPEQDWLAAEEELRTRTRRQ